MIDREFWRGQSVFVTGHTGFKGGWLATWLLDLGSRISGYALPPDTTPSLFAVTGLGGRMTSILGDIRDLEKLTGAVRKAQPTVIFHLAAQPLVRRSYREPLETVTTNVVGTANLLEAARQAPTVRAIVVVTTDKCYESRESGRGYREEDPLGGQDLYSASKACAELIAHAYRRSFFERGDATVGLATARAGNVIGGGDWAEDRLVPDAVKSLLENRPLRVRNPNSTRPWQHVLEPLSGYLLLAERLVRRPAEAAGSWNFGPGEGEEASVGALADLIVRCWGGGRWEAAPEAAAPPETGKLKLDSSKARRVLGWKPRWSLERSVEQTVSWYRAAATPDRRDGLHALCQSQIAQYATAEPAREAH